MTYLLASDHNTVFVLDEPDVYLHPDLQHKLLRNILSRVGQLFIATHSSEIINEVEPGDVVMVRPGARSGKRIKTEADYGDLFNLIGSSENAQFSRLARTKKVLYLEGNDRKLLRKIGASIGFTKLFEDSETTFMKTEGFENWNLVGATSTVFKEMFGFDVKVAAIFDRDYRSRDQIEEFEAKLQNSSVFVRVLPCKEIENILLVERAIIEAVRKIVNQVDNPDWTTRTQSIIDEVSFRYKNDVFAVMIGELTQYMSAKTKRFDGKSLSTNLQKDLDSAWSNPAERLKLVPGKSCFAEICKELKHSMNVSLTPHRVANELRQSDIDPLILEIFSGIADHFS